ncbi:MAG: hypothetical protein ACRDNZ_23845 [Streptosporangiaceae bacterium]
MANQAGSEIVAETAAPAEGEPSQASEGEMSEGEMSGGVSQGQVSGSQAGALADPGHGMAYHGRPVSWVAVTIIIAGFLTGGLSLVVAAWATFWVGVGLVVAGTLLAVATNMFEDWY